MSDVQVEAHPEVSYKDLRHVKNIGSGSFGRVTLAQHIDTGKYYAVKAMSKRKIIALRQVAHINNECNILRAIKSPFIIRQYGAYQDDKNVYIILDFIQGGELFYHLRRYNKFPLQVVKFFAVEILLALGYLHGMGIAYRDLKLENVLIDNTGHIKLADLGFAKRLVEKNADGDTVSQLTFSIVGTPEYLAPEIIRSTGHDMSADWWAFGILIYEMLTGSPPFFDDNPDMTCKKILGGKISFASGFDKTAKDLIVRLLNPDKTRRLGASINNGTADIMKHAFFSGVNWSWFEKKVVKAPIVPKLTDPADTANYEDYLDENGNFEEEEIDYENLGTDATEMGLAEIPETQEEIDALFADFK